jgi:hypothetical protein
MTDTEIFHTLLIRDEYPDRPNHIKDRLWDLMNNCWDHEASNRLKVKEIVEKLDALVVEENAERFAATSTTSLDVPPGSTSFSTIRPGSWTSAAEA